jgi:negative regulator of sigma E activity
MDRWGGDLVSAPSSADRAPGPGHPDTGELADEIAGIAGPAIAEHLAGCRTCSGRLAALTTASVSVSEYLRADPEPELPAAVAARFAAAIAAESAARPAVSPSAVTATAASNRPSSRPRPRPDGWWARHTRLGGVLVTAATLVVVGGGGTVVANMLRNGNTNQAGVQHPTAQEDAAAPGSDLGARATPLGATAGAMALHKTAFAAEIDDLVNSKTRTARSLTPRQRTCARGTFAGSALDNATLTALSGTFTLDGTPVVVVLASQAGTNTAVAISGCSSQDPQVAARADLP